MSCFHLPTLTHVRRLDPEIPTAFLHLGAEMDWDDFAGLVAGGGHVALHPWDWLVDEALVAAAQRAGLEVNVWTVDDPERMAALVAMGVHGLCQRTNPAPHRQVLGVAQGADQHRSPAVTAGDAAGR